MVNLYHFIELKPFARNRESFLGDESYREFQEYLQLDPTRGATIGGTGGFKKIRWALDQGKSGGVRIIYYFVGKSGRIYLATIYGKGQQSSLSAEQKEVLKSISAKLKEE